MADRISEIAEGALKALESKSPARSHPGTEDPSIDPGNSPAFDALFRGEKIIVSVKDPCCPKIGELKRELTRFAGSASGLRFEMVRDGKEPAPRKAAAPSSAVSPEKQVLQEILADVISHEGSCIVEPGKACTGCKGRCSNLGF